jgi:hypothetical protein
VLKLKKKAPGVRWGGYHDLSVFLPEKDGMSLKLNKPIHVAENCVGMSNHSGGYSFAVTTGRRTHVVYTEIPEKRNGGNPTYAVTIDRKKRMLTAKKFLVTAKPNRPDVHSTPVIAADRNGYLHVATGAHGQEFLYLRSLKPDDIESGWTTPLPMSDKQTYATLICDKENRLHSVFRRWPGPHLCYQHKDAMAVRWSEPRIVVRPPPGHKGYGIFYHRMFIDRGGALYLSFTFFESDTGKKGQYPRALAVSEDGGKSWELATTETFRRRLTLTK